MRAGLQFRSEPQTPYELSAISGICPKISHSKTLAHPFDLHFLLSEYLLRFYLVLDLWYWWRNSDCILSNSSRAQYLLVSILVVQHPRHHWAEVLTLVMQAHLASKICTITTCRIYSSLRFLARIWNNDNNIIFENELMRSCKHSSRLSEYLQNVGLMLHRTWYSF